MYYKQAEVPFDRVTLDYIEALDPEKDIDFMEKHGVSLRPSCLDLFRFSTYMLKWCAHKGFTAYEIACLMCKDAYERKFDMPHAQVHLDLFWTEACAGSQADASGYQSIKSLVF